MSKQNIVSAFTVPARQMITRASSAEMARAAPNWEAMKRAIVLCERKDEIRDLSDKALALRLYYAQSGDAENEVRAMRVRLRAERRFGELLEAAERSGEMARRGDNRFTKMSTPSTSTLADLGVTRDRAARAKQLAAVEEEEFEAALAGERPSSRALAKLAPKRNGHGLTTEQATKLQERVDVSAVLATWGMLRDIHLALKAGKLLPAPGWTRHPGIQPFQCDEIRAALRALVPYLTALEREP